MAKKSKKTVTTKVQTSNFEPGDYASKYQFDLSTGTVQPKNGHAEVPEYLKSIAFQDEGNGTFSAMIPHLAGGASLPSAHGSISHSFDFTDLQAIAENKKDDRQNMRLAIAYWKVDPLVFKCTKVLTQLANSKLHVQCENETAKTLLENWMEQAMPFSFRQAWFREFFRSSMVPSLKTLVEYVPRELKSNKIPLTGEDGNVDAEEIARATAVVVDRRKRENEEYDQAVAAVAAARERFKANKISKDQLEAFESAMAAKQHAWAKGMIAGAYTILDPLAIELKGPAGIAWLRDPYLKVANEVVQAVKHPTKYQEEVLNQMPVEIVQQILEGKNEVWLSPNTCQITYGEKQPYEKYPSPIASHAFRALQIKHEMMETDRCTTKQLRDRILKVTIGNDQFPVTDPQQIMALAAMFASRNQSMTLFWDHTLKIEWIQPDVEHLVNNTKYDLWNDEIRTAYGINKVFTGTESKGSTGGDILNLKGVVEEVTEAQERYIEFLNGEVKLLKASLGISADIWFTFDSLNLRNENDYMAVVMQMVTNGLIDVKTALETMGYHFPTIKSRMKAQQALRDEGLFLPTPSANNLGPDGIATPGGGKPKGLTGPSSNNKNKLGKPQPKKKTKAQATARMATTADGTMYVVIDADELDAEYQEAVAELFDIDVDQVVTDAAFTASHGKDMSPPALPALSHVEMLRAVKEGSRIYQQVIQKQEELVVADVKSRGNGKAKYRTKKLEDEKKAQALTLCVEPLRPPAVADMWWKSEVEVAQASLVDAGIFTDPAELTVVASLIVAARFSKLSPTALPAAA